jgi:AraC-like DNA-binding protein
MIKTNHPSTADFVVPTENLQAVVSLLLSNKISFKLTVLNQLESTSKTVKSTDTSTHSESTPQDIKLAQNQSTTTNTYSTLSQKEMILASIYKKYITPNMDNIPPNESQIATDYGISLMTFRKGFKAVYGKTFFQLYTDKKMEYAKALILQGVNATNVSKRLGYTSPIKFNILFERYFGMSPKKYQISHRDNPSYIAAQQ